MKAIAHLLMMALSVPVSAGIIRHDISDNQYVEFAKDPIFNGVGLITMATTSESNTCSGTVIHKNWVLTAGHCVNNAVGMSFYLPSDKEWRIYEATSWVTHENYSTAGIFPEWDIGLIYFDTEFDVTPAQLYTGESELLSPMISIGLGRTGNGLTGDMEMDYKRRAGTNYIDDLLSNEGNGHQIMWADFDHPTDPSFNYKDYPDLTFDDLASSLEIMVAPGDSGGGLFIEDDGNFYLAGVHSCVGDINGDGISGYGDTYGSTRVSSFTDWINNKIFSVSEPAPWWLSALGFAALYLRRRQDKVQQ